MKWTKDANANGTHLVGTVNTTYDELVQCFGEPDLYNGDKTNVEWCLEFADGTVATIYDWKMPEVPYGYYDWHIGGKSYLAVERVQDAMLEPLTQMIKEYGDNAQYHGA